MYSCVNKKKQLSARDCGDIRKLNPSARDGMYDVYPFEKSFELIRVFCHLEPDNSGWIVSFFVKSSYFFY